MYGLWNDRWGPRDRPRANRSVYRSPKTFGKIDCFLIEVLTASFILHPSSLDTAFITPAALPPFNPYLNQ